MAARVRVDLVNAGMRQLVNHPGVRAHLEARGERILAQARSDAPVDSGAFRDSLRMLSTITTDRLWGGGTRVAVRVGSDDPAALLIEAKTGLLARALSAGGVTAKARQ